MDPRLVGRFQLLKVLKWCFDVSESVSPRSLLPVPWCGFYAGWQ